MKKTQDHIGLIQMGIRQVQDEIVFTISPQVMSRALADAEGTLFRPDPVADTSRWHWLADMHELSNRTIDPYLGLPKDESVDAPAIIRDIVEDVVIPPCEAHMDDRALLAERIPSLSGPLNLGRYRQVLTAGFLAASLQDLPTLRACVALFDDALRGGGVPPVPTENLEADRDALRALCA